MQYKKYLIANSIIEVGSPLFWKLDPKVKFDRSVENLISGVIGFCAGVAVNHNFTPHVL